MHVSTAYVCGATHSVATETLYHTAPPGTADPFPRGLFATSTPTWRAFGTIIERCENDSAQPDVEREFTRILLERSRSSRSGKTAGRRKVVESLRRKWLDNRLVAAGMEWARPRGWNDTYTYTKALGEQMVVRACGGAPTVIVRPSVIESSLSEPTPGWLDGLRMADPLILAIGKGRLRSLPLRPDVNLDLVPVDMVVNAMLAATPRAAPDSGLADLPGGHRLAEPDLAGDALRLHLRLLDPQPDARQGGPADPHPAAALPQQVALPAAAPACGAGRSSAPSAPSRSCRTSAAQARPSGASRRPGPPTSACSTTAPSTSPT